MGFKEEKVKLLNDRLCYLPRPTKTILRLDREGYANAEAVIDEVGFDSWHTCIEFGYWVGD